MTEFSFDEWAKLAVDDPAEFERRRAQVLQNEILKAPPEHRMKLRLIQTVCDGIRESMPPLEAAAEMTRLATEKLQELKTPLTQLRAVCEDLNED
jgi:hypothetical protein